MSQPQWEGSTWQDPAVLPRQPERGSGARPDGSDGSEVPEGPEGRQGRDSGGARRHLRLVGDGIDTEPLRLEPVPTPTATTWTAPLHPRGPAAGGTGTGGTGTGDAGTGGAGSRPSTQRQATGRQGAAGPSATTAGRPAPATFPVTDPRQGAQAPATRPPDALVHQLVQAVMDALSGHRPVSQFVRWSTAEVFDALSQRALLEQSQTRRPGARTRAVVRRVHVQQVAFRRPAGGDDGEDRRDGWARGLEVTATVTDGARVRAVASRLDLTGGRWRVTALEIG